MPLFLRTRRRTDEFIDRPDADEGELRRSLAYIRKINHWLEYTDVTIAHFDAFSKHWEHGRTYRILDVATGSADIPWAILKWADGRGFKVEVVGIDLHAQILKIAEEDGPDPRLKLMRADAMNLPFADGAFDYGITAMFLHHLDDADVVRVLREMDRVSARGLVVSDLLRNARAYAWITMFTLFSTRMVRHDGPASVAQAFTEAEAMAFRERAGIGYTQYKEHFAHRFSLAGEKTAT
jgi:2-polyprenyl-3-methyl-5-hydroxy-6-metoxy-1,4-benzoquinol methylase